MSDTCSECGLEACHSKTCPYVKRLEEIWRKARALVCSPDDSSETLDRLKAELATAVDAQTPFELVALGHLKRTASPEKLDAAVKRFRVQLQSAAHYRVPFNSQAWAESIAREYGLTEVERQEFIARLRKESV